MASVDLESPYNPSAYAATAARSEASMPFNEVELTSMETTRFV